MPPTSQKGKFSTSVVESGGCLAFFFAGELILEWTDSAERLISDILMSPEVLSAAGNSASFVSYSSSSCVTGTGIV